MVLLNTDVVKLKILKTLYNVQTEISMNNLRVKIGVVNYYTVSRNIEFLELMGFVKIDKKVIETRVYNFISLTNKGKKFTINEILKNGEI